MNFHLNDEISVLVGCGLGGTSLINANVALRVDERVYHDGKWPKAFVDDIHDGLEHGFSRAEEMLKPTTYPSNYPPLRRMEAHEKSAEFIDQPFYKTPINVNYENKINHVGVEQTACINCGDCVSGCNHTSKNTTQMNYLPDAWNHGAEIFTECNVSHIEKKDGKWCVFFKTVNLGRKKFDAPLLFVTAEIVVLGAGTLGSTEIMLRSRNHGLPVSDHLGKGFSGNGDVLGFGYNNDQEINGIGYGTKDPDKMEPCGPGISSVIDTRETSEHFEDGLIIEEGSIPGALSTVLPLAFTTLSKLIGEDTDSGLIDELQESGREVESLIRGAYHGSVNNTQTYLIMSHDSDSGVMKLNEHDRLEIEWKGVGNEAIIQKANDTLEKCTKALGGTFVKNPIWTRIFGKDLISVHPLGGCIMGEDVSKAVVNHKGQVFDKNGGIHEGLYIADGSIIPASLGVNPHLCITAVAERNLKLMADDYGWQLDYTLPSKPRKVIDKKPGIRFTETMKGFFSTKVQDDYLKGAQVGEQENSSFEFTLTIQSDDVKAMIEDPDHEADMAGTVIAPLLSPEPLMAAGGKFNLFVQYEKEVNTRRMNYTMPLKGENGEQYFFEGYKQIDAEDGPEIWKEASTLYITVYDGIDNSGEIMGKGILRIEPLDFLKQMTSMKAVNTNSKIESLNAVATFGKFFAGSLFDTYGGILRKDNSLKPDAAPRKKRPLRVTAPTVHYFKTKDNVSLKLTRYKGGTKGPVICSHGLGVSSAIFSTDLIDTNLLEFLYVHDYDVWLLDYRASIDLPVSNGQFSGDDIAKYDYPAAVKTVLDISGAKDVQMVVHCFGSTTWTMAMLNGLEGVRSAVCSQVSTHAVAPTSTRIKSGLHIPAFLDAIGIDSLTAFTDEGDGWMDKAFNKMLKINPIPYDEQCDSPVCHRVTFMYSLLYEHSQLNQATHDHLHELFGIANIESLKHLAQIVRKGHVTNIDGDDEYLPKANNMAIPIRFISGSENCCFLPESTEKTYKFLCETNGEEYYDRKVIPGYGHIDCIFGENAVNDVYPLIVEHLEKHNK